VFRSAALWGGYGDDSILRLTRGDRGSVNQLHVGRGHRIFFVTLIFRVHTLLYYISIV
jgi:hypothetical protein